jgi:hypothetical protein
MAGDVLGRHVQAPLGEHFLGRGDDPLTVALCAGPQHRPDRQVLLGCGLAEAGMASGDQ